VTPHCGRCKANQRQGGREGEGRRQPVAKEKSELSPARLTRERLGFPAGQKKKKKPKQTTQMGSRANPLTIPGDTTDPGITKRIKKRKISPVRGHLEEKNILNADRADPRSCKNTWMKLLHLRYSGQRRKNPKKLKKVGKKRLRNADKKNQNPTGAFPRDR